MFEISSSPAHGCGLCVPNLWTESLIDLLELLRRNCPVAGALLSVSLVAVLRPRRWNRRLRRCLVVSDAISKVSISFEYALFEIGCDLVKNRFGLLAVSTWEELCTG